MKQLPMIELPDSFSRFLVTDIQSAYPYELKAEATRREDFREHLEFSTKLEAKDFNLDQMLKALSPKKTRDRLAALYLFYQEEGIFPVVIDEVRVQPVLEIEKKLSLFTVEGYSRHFLLGFYLQMSSIATSYNYMDLVNNDVISLLKLSKKKSIEIDLVTLLLIHSINFIGHDRTRDALKHSGYQSLLALWSESDRDFYHRNMISYAFSTSLGDVLSSTKV